MTTVQLFETESLLEEARQAAKRRDYVNAEPVFKKAIEKRIAAVGENDPSVADFMHELARYYIERGNDAAALDQLNKAVTVIEKAFYPGHAKLAPILDDIADIYIKQGKFADAEPVLVRLLDIVEKTMSGDHRYNYTTMHKLAYVYRKLEKYAEAEKILLKALKTIDTPLGPCEEFKLDLALVYLDQGKNPEADTNFQQAITGFHQRNNYSRMAEALEAYADFLKQQGRKEEAQQAEARAKHIRATNHADEHPNDIFPSTLLRA